MSLFMPDNNSCCSLKIEKKPDGQPSVDIVHKFLLLIPADFIIN